MRPICKRLFAQARAAHYRMCELTQELQRELVSSADLSELADAVFALRKSEDLLEDARKECGVLLTLMEKVTCLRWLADQTQKHEPIRTEYCTASPDVKQTVKTPRKDTPEYGQLLAHFGVPAGVPFAPHWPSMLKRIDADLAAGKPLPPGCDPNEMLQVCVVRTLKRKRPILDEGEAVDLATPDCLKSSYVLVDAIREIPLDSIHHLLSAIEGMRTVKSVDMDAEEAEDAVTQAEVDATAVSHDGAPSFMSEEMEATPF